MVTVAFLLVVAGAMVFVIAMCVIRLKRYVVLTKKIILESFSGNLVFIISALLPHCNPPLLCRSVPGTVVQNYRLRRLLSDVDEESSQFATDHEQSTTLL